MTFHDETVELELDGQSTFIGLRGQEIGYGIIDVLVEKQLVVELKSLDVLLGVHRAQVVSYLQASRLQLGLLINFNVTHLRNGIKRVIWNGSPDPQAAYRSTDRWR